MSVNYNVGENGITLETASLVNKFPQTVASFASNFTYRTIENEEPDTLVFEMKGIDVSYANALRRIMIGEVPTMAIEHVFIWMNTSITHDEVLSHRLGLIPLYADPDDFQNVPEGGSDDATDQNCLVFKLVVECQKEEEMAKGTKAEKNKNMKEQEIENSNLDKAAKKEAKKLMSQKDTSIAQKPYTQHVYASDLTWHKQGNQTERLSYKPKAIQGDILITKLRPGQKISLECHAMKSNGVDHAKYSPVATASYRLMPKITLLEPIYDEDADELMMYEPGVFKLVKCDSDSDSDSGHDRKAILFNEYACTMSRNYMRNERLSKAVKIDRISDHFIFNIESSTVMTATEILLKSIEILQNKSEQLMNGVRAMSEPYEKSEDMEEEEDEE